MVIKTELDVFSENRVYPGWGRHFVTRIGQLIITGTSKTSSLYHQRKKPALLRWTQAWRRQHKKLNVEAQQKKRTRKVIKVARAIVGANLEELKKKKADVKKAPVAPAAAAGAAAAAKKVVQPSVAEAKAKAKAAQAQRKAGQTKGPALQKHAAGKGRF